MATFDKAWYCTSVGWTAVTAWSTAAKVAGQIVRQTAPTAGNERVFICIIAGTPGAAEPAWTVTRGARTTDGTVTWQECTGASAINGDLTNTPNWTTVKGQSITLGQIIKRDSEASYQICSTAGTAGGGAEPGFSDTAGVTTADNTVTWTSLGAVTDFTGNEGPFARLENAVASTWAIANNFIYLKSDHAQTAGAAVNINIASAATQNAPLTVVCHDGGQYPPTSSNVTTGAAVTSTGTNTIQFGVSGGQGVHYYGINFNCATGAAAVNFAILGGTAPSWINFEQCNLRLVSTSNSARIHVGQSGNAVQCRMLNSNFKFSSSGQHISTLSGSGFLTWRGGGLESGTTVPSNLFSLTQSAGTQLGIICEGVDLSAVTTTLVTNNQATASKVLFKDCKLSSGVTVYATTAGVLPGAVGPQIDVVRSDNAAVDTRAERYRYEGTETTELTVVRTGGAQTPSGTSFARKVITSSNVSYTSPFESFPISVWNPTTSSAITATVYGTWGGAAVPTNRQFWITAEYLGSSATPQGSFVTTASTNLLDSATSLSTDNSTWGGGTTPFKASVTLTAGMAGPITMRCYMNSTVSSTFYFDPKIVLS